MRFGVGGCCVMKRWWRGLISLQGAARPSKAGLAFEKSERGAFSTCALFTLTRVWSDTMRTIALGAVTELQVARGSAESAIRSFPRSASSRPLRHTLYHKTPPQQHPGMWKPNPTDRITEYESRLSIPDPVPCNLATSRRLVTIPEIHNISESQHAQGASHGLCIALEHCIMPPSAVTARILAHWPQSRQNRKPLYQQDFLRLRSVQGPMLIGRQLKQLDNNLRSQVSTVYM
jgi:hypothetical protein